MSNEKRRGNDDKKRIRLSDGTYGVYMGQTGGQKRKGAPAKTGRQNGNGVGGGRPNVPPAGDTGARRREAANNSPGPQKSGGASSTRRNSPKGRAVNNKNDKKFFSAAIDKVRTWWLSISIDADNIIKGVVIGAFILLFAMLQTTIFSRFGLFGATPDLMLSLVIAIGATEGERWGGVCGLVCAFLIEAIGSTATVTLLPLLYMPCGFIVGVMAKIYFRDSVIVRGIYTAIAAVLRCVVTVIYVLLTYKAVSGTVMFRQIVIPEYFSTLVMSVIPHTVVWLSMKPFHKSRAERVS